MILRYTQRKEAKCNFCFDWFWVSSTTKNPLNLCSVCLDKALKTTCYKIPSPDGKESYQLYLLKNNLRIEHHGPEQNAAEQLKNMLLEDIDDFRNRELSKLSAKWASITAQIQAASITEHQMNKYTQIFESSVNNYPSAEHVLSKLHQNTSALSENKENFDNVQSPSQVYLSIGAYGKVPTKDKVNSQNKNGYVSPYRAALKEVKSNANKAGQLSALSKKSGSSCSNARTKNVCNQEDTKVNSFNFNGDSNLQQIKLAQSSSQKILLDKQKRDVMLSKERREKDLEMIAQSALKSKIYVFLETFSIVPPALYLPMTLGIYDAIQNTNCLNKCIQLVGYSMQDLDINCYLNMLEWKGVEVLKLVKVRLSDQQFSQVVEFLKGKSIETLVVSSNKLSESSVINLKEACLDVPTIKNVYFGRNRIQKMKVKDTIREIQSRFVVYL